MKVEGWCRLGIVLTSAQKFIFSIFSLLSFLYICIILVHKCTLYLISRLFPIYIEAMLIIHTYNIYFLYACKVIKHCSFFGADGANFFQRGTYIYCTILCCIPISTMYFLYSLYVHTSFVVNSVIYILCIPFLSYIRREIHGPSEVQNLVGINYRFFLPTRRFCGIFM